jgi:coenzyme F420-reducing hydrogenase beta subunit
VIKIIDRSKCCGCTACFSVCPQKAINMFTDEEGFLYPKVDQSKCIECQICDHVCKFQVRLSEEKNDDWVETIAYAAKNKSKEILAKSTSGGIFTALSDYVLKEGGSVFGAAFDQLFRVHHIRALTSEQRDQMRGSKYVQSDMESIFEQVKSDLKNGKKVLFTGTPCQVDGLYGFLRGHTNGLYTCDLICHGTPSPMVWNSHVSFISKLKRSKLKEYHFRPKDWTWHVHNEKAIFYNGKVYHSTGYANMFRNLYYSGLIMRPSCYRCPYSKLKRYSDITIADCRGIDKVLSDIASDEGVSLVIINSKIGAELFSAIDQSIESYPINIIDVIQPPLKKPCNINPRRDEFWSIYRKKGYRAAINKMYGRFFNLKNIIRNILKKRGKHN